MYTVGQRVMVKRLGAAIVLGFERFDKAGNNAPMSLTDIEGDTSRVICKLDNPSNFMHNGEPYNPYVMRHDLNPLSD